MGFGTSRDFGKAFRCLLLDVLDAEDDLLAHAGNHWFIFHFGLTYDYLDFSTEYSQFKAKNWRLKKTAFRNKSCSSCQYKGVLLNWLPPPLLTFYMHVLVI